MSVQNLTGTMWVFNEYVTSSSYTRYNLTGSVRSTVNDITYISQASDSDLNVCLSLSTYNAISIFYRNDGQTQYNYFFCVQGMPYLVNNGWFYKETALSSNQIKIGLNSVILLITGGDDVETPSLISWLEANATLCSPRSTITIDNTSIGQFDTGANMLVNANGLYNETTSTQVYTYSSIDNKKFLGFSLTANSARPSSMYEIGDRFVLSADLNLFKIDLSPVFTLSLLPYINRSTNPLSVGTNNIKIKRVASGSAYQGYTDSEFSNIIPYHVYSITPQLVGCSAASGNISKIGDNQSTILTYNFSGSYKCPENAPVISPAGAATAVWTKNSNSSGQLAISNVTDNITFTVEGELSGYLVTVTFPYIPGTEGSNLNEGAAIYDGQNDNGTLLISEDSGTYSIICESGYLYMVAGGSDSGSLAYTLSGNIEVVDAGRHPNIYDYAVFKVTGSAEISDISSSRCFVEGTKISLSDGTTKNIEDITYDDELLTWDFYEGKLASAKPAWIMKECTASEYKLITLSDGTKLKLVGSGDKCHRLFNVTKQQMLYANECVGDEVFKQDGTIVTVLSCERIQEVVKYYNLTTENYYDCFAEGVLTGSRLNNMYHITDMKYDSDVRLISEVEETERWVVRKSLMKSK